MRPPRMVYSRSGSTPIYDALCAEYRRLFRALPGDRSGEEELRFISFALRETEVVPPQQGRHRSGQLALPSSIQGSYGNRMRDR